MSGRLGYVTFSDILGWKGIWRSGDYSCLDKIIAIKEKLEKKKNFIKYKDVLEILDELSILKVNDKDLAEYQLLKEAILNEKDIKITINTIIDKYLQKVNDIIKEKIKIKQSESDIKQEIKKFLNNKKDNLINIGLNNEIDKSKIEELLKDNESRKINLRIVELLKDKDVYIKIDLISDTFVITSEEEGKSSNERLIHLEICKELILECLNNELLIRGATAYGKYYNKNTVYVGPAIDESASWHEQGDEIGIFLTKSAELKDNSEIQDILKKHTVNVKRGKLENALVIDWTKGEKQFYDKFKKESPFLPEIALKYINSEKFLKNNKLKIIE